MQERDDNNNKDLLPGEERPSQKKGGVNKVKKGLLIASIVAMTGLSAAAVIGAKEGYDFAFKRFNRPDYSLLPGAYCIDRYASLHREELSFFSDNVRLQGYYYPCEGAKGVVVLAHGIHAGADDYLPIADYLVKNGYAVFSFDYKGTYDSDGDSTVGMCESLVDLDHALSYVECSTRFFGLPIFLIGHSWGGYAVSSVLALHKSVRGCACISAPANGYTLILEKGAQYAGKAGSTGIPALFLNTYQKILFGSYVNYDAVKGINATDVPVLIAHGENDEVINVRLQSVMSHRSELREENVTYYSGYGVQGGHDSIWHSKASIEYKKNVDATIKSMKKSDVPTEKIKEYIATVDHALYSEVNGELFDKIVAMFDGALE